MRQNQRLSSAESLAFEGPAAELAAHLLEKMSSLFNMVRGFSFTRQTIFNFQNNIRTRPLYLHANAKPENYRHKHACRSGKLILK
jgi:hypothetical protein